MYRVIEQVRQCKHCGTSMQEQPPRGYAENPYCGNCLNERLVSAHRSAAPAEWVREGSYLVLKPIARTAA